MTGQLNGHFFMCTETSPRCFVIQKLDASTITQKTLSNVAKNLPQNNGNDQYQVDPSNPPFPNLPYWFNDEIEKNLIQISEGIPPTSHFNNQQTNDSQQITTIPNIQVTEANSENIKINPENKKLQQPDKINDQKSETNMGEDDKRKELEEKLRIQLEYYFSRENLATDKYLKGQMDSEGYVPIKIIANFRKVSALTNDIDFIIKVLKDSNMLQVDKNCEKVRVGAKRSTLILREITENNGEDMVKELLKGGPEWKRICYASNNSWYVTYDDDESCGKACLVIQEQAKKLGKDISVRIKTGGVPIHHENHYSSSSNVSTTASSNIITNNNTFVNGNISSYLNPLSIIPYPDNFLIPSQCQNYSPIGKNNYEGMNFINKNYNKLSIINGFNCGNKANLNSNFGPRGSISPRRLSPLPKNNYGKKHNSFSPSKQIEKMDLGPILTLSGFYPTAAYKPSTEDLREIPLPPNPNIFMNSGQHYRNNKGSVNLSTSGGHNTTNNTGNIKKTSTTENSYGKRAGTYKGSQHYNYNNQLPENIKNNIGNFHSFVKHNNSTNLNNSNSHQQNNFISSDNKNNHQFNYNNNKSNNSFHEKNFNKYNGKNYIFPSNDESNKRTYKYSNESNSSSSSGNYGKLTLFNNSFRGSLSNTIPSFKGKGNNFNSGNECFKKFNSNYEKNSSTKNKKEGSLDINDDKNDEISKRVSSQKFDEENTKVFWRIKDSNEKTKDSSNKSNIENRKKFRTSVNSGKSSNDIDIFKIPEESTKESFTFDVTKNSENISPNINSKIKEIVNDSIKSIDDSESSKSVTPKPPPKYNFNEGEFPVLCEVTEKLAPSSLSNKNQKKVSLPNGSIIQFSDIASGKNKTSSPDENIDERKSTASKKSYAETLLVDKI